MFSALSKPAYTFRCTCKTNHFTFTLIEAVAFCLTVHYSFGFFFFFTRWYSHSWRFLGEKSNNKKTTHRRQKDANHLAFYLYGICCECIQWALSLQLMILISHGRHSARMVAMEIIYVFTPNSTQPAMGHWLFVKTRNCGCWDCALWYAEHFERGIENHCTKPKWIMLWIGFQTCLLISNMI